MCLASRLTAVDLFCGCGGMTLGLKEAGFSVVAGVDIDPASLEAYRANHPEVTVYERDIRELDPSVMAEELGIGPGDLDLLVGCPPCQGFSSVRTLNGAKSVEDPRNDLLFEFYRFAAALQPKALMLENVPGLVRNARFTAFCERLETLGYFVSHRVLDAAQYGVPQRRRRLILVGGRGYKVSFARPTGAVPTVREAIGSLRPAGGSGDPLHDFPERRNERIRRLIAAIPKDGGSRGDLSEDWQLACHRRCDGFKDVYGRMSWDRPAPTITGGCFNPSKGRFLHPEEDRAITMREAALLQGFPPWYRFPHRRGKVVVAALIGNALPPPFVRRHAVEVARALTRHAGLEGGSMDVERTLLEGLTEEQRSAVCSPRRQVLVVAGAGSGKTEVMARRMAWWVAVEGIPRDRIVAFTFTERAAEEMKLRIRRWLCKAAPEGSEITLGGMWVGTIHAFCLKQLRELWPEEYHHFDILDEAARVALVPRGYNDPLELSRLRDAVGAGLFETVEGFCRTYDQLQEHNQFDVRTPDEPPPTRLGRSEWEWCRRVRLLTDVGKTPEAAAFADCAARYYGFLKCRRFLDFSTSQTEFFRRLRSDPEKGARFHQSGVRIVVDEVQDINPVQEEIIRVLAGTEGHVTAVGDHRQAIYGFRGAKVEIIANLWEELRESVDGEVVDLEANFRSTPRIIEIANRWAQTISPLKKMKVRPMRHGNARRVDHHPSHCALIPFDNRLQEARWIAQAVRVLVPSEVEGVEHDKRSGGTRGITLSDIAVLLRSSTDVRTYMEALREESIPCVVQAGPDLFSQPEVLFFTAALALTAGVDEFYGSPSNPKSLRSRIAVVLGCDPDPRDVLEASAAELKRRGLPLAEDAVHRIEAAVLGIRGRLYGGDPLDLEIVGRLHTPELKRFLLERGEVRRVFPQKIFHYLLAEAGVALWDACSGAGEAALFHLGALSRLITAVETPGWTSPAEYRWQIIGLCQHGAVTGRAEEQPLMARPEAVTVSTVHAAKGLEFAVVFLADVNAQRFPSSYAKRRPALYLDGTITTKIDAAALADNDNYDGERRLMYVALTRAERFLFISCSGPRRSRFFRELQGVVAECGGYCTADSKALLRALRYAPKEHYRDLQVSTSFSDLRYYLECPHDFYLRKVLGFSPTIDQAFGYGRGVHNLLRAVHSNPGYWAALADDPAALERELYRLIGRGVFYLRYTTGEPAENMRAKALKIVANYIRRFAPELRTSVFEPEKSFETLIEYDDAPGGVLVSGAIDVVKLEDPPRVVVIDFKSGDPESDRHQKLDADEMALQVTLYAFAAKKELEYVPERGLVRYLDADDSDRSELTVSLDEGSLAASQRKILDMAKRIRDRRFNAGPNPKYGDRCQDCDFLGFCGREEARLCRSRRLSLSGKYGT